MKIKKIYLLGGILATAALAFGCQLDESFDVTVEEKVPISMKGDINQLAVTRASDNGFAAGDQVGIWAVNFIDEDTPGTLALKDNQATNVRFTFDGSYWAADYDIYYKDKNTKVDIYGIYPYSSAISSIEAWPFEVQEDQSTVSAHGMMGGYEASDFLWAKREAVTPSPSTVQLLFQHKMSCVVVTLEEGTGFEAGEFAGLSQSVLINNVKRNATINLATGEVTATGAVPARSTVPAAYENGFRAIVVPQTVSSASTLFSITLGGTAYTYSEGSAFTYVPGKQHNFTVTVDKKADGGYNVTVQTTISAWTNDNSSHEFVAKEYVVVNVETPGTLGETLTAAGKNPDAIKYLKVLGTVNADDFYFMRDNMAVLQGVNMQETKVVEGKIPDNAFSEKKTLNSFVFPDGEHDNVLSSIDGFSGTSLTGAVMIPQGVVSVGGFGATQITSVSFPNSLKTIANDAFSGCMTLSGNLSLPESLEIIGNNAFNGCNLLTGNLDFPSSLNEIGESAFYGCTGLYGRVVFPTSMSEIASRLFSNTGINSIVLHDGITKIGNDAFKGCNLKGEVLLPSNLQILGDGAFAYTLISGTIVFPESLVYLGKSVFDGCWRLSGVVSIPESITTINQDLFMGCSNLEGVILPSGVVSIVESAFRGCFQLNSIVSRAITPPIVGNYAFEGVAKDNFTLEVPASSVNLYATAEGWREFNRISEYRNFSVSRRLFRGMNDEESLTVILRAESGSAWTVESHPDWVSICPSSGVGKTDITVTVDALEHGSGTRDGEIVFLLEGDNYRCSMTVEQCDYAYGDGSVLVKQTHSIGSGIPLVFLGDCYDAVDIASGMYLEDIEEAIGYFFDIEPYKTYKDYFDVYIVFGKSEDSGVGSINTVKEARFGTQYSLTGGTLQNNGAEVFKYALKANAEIDISKSLVVVVLNSTDYGGVTYLWNNGSALAICPKSADPYPYDFRGVVQHEAGGHGFGKLADEYIYMNSFIDNCDCRYSHLKEFLSAKANGWYKNLSETADRDEVPWSHLMYHPDYLNMVDIYEGGFFHTRGIFRSEPNSCMNNNIEYYSAISRQAIVERIMDYAGLPFVQEDFYTNDVRTVATRASLGTHSSRIPSPFCISFYEHHHPIIMGDHPDLN